jgi:hypothetical protein
VTEFKTAADYWAGVVEPDYQDCRNNPADLRIAFHAALSLFHMHDWIWKTHEAAVRASFTFTDKNGTVVKVHDKGSFANALEQQCGDFGRVRGIANAAKHFDVEVRPIPNAPGNATDTAVRTTAYGEGPYGGGPFGGTSRVMLVGPNGSMEFSDVIKGAYEMWNTLRANYGW